MLERDPGAGTAMALIHKVGPDCGIAEVVLDGEVIKEIDTYAPTVDWNKTTVLVDKPTEENVARTLKVRVTGRKNARSTNAHVQIVCFAKPDHP